MRTGDRERDGIGVAAEAPTGPAAVGKFLAEFSASERAEALHLALKQLGMRGEPDRVLACELGWEVHVRGYWSQLRRDDGRPYETEEVYFADVLGLTSWRTAYKRLAIGRMLTAFAEPERATIRAAIAEVGLAKASIIAPAIERTSEWASWVQWAREMSAANLQAQVSAALHALPRGCEAAPPGERFRRLVLASMPDIEAMAVVERFFDVGAMVVETAHPIAIFLAGCRECLGEWEFHAARRHRAPAAVIRDPATAESATVESEGLPTWAKPHALNETA